MAATNVNRRIPIGPVQCFINGVRVGSPKSSAVLNYAYTLAIGMTGDNTAELNARKTKEVATIQISVADLKTKQLRYAFANAKSLITNSLLTTNYMASSSVTIRQTYLLTNLTGLAITTGLSPSIPYVYTSGTVVVYSGDYETEYTVATDYITNTTCDAICRVTGGAIASGANVIAEYDAITTVSYVRAGGADAVTEDAIKLVGQDQQGKYFQFQAWRAVREGNMNLQVNLDSEYPGQTLTWHLLADPTNYGKGSQLFEVAVQA